MRNIFKFKMYNCILSGKLYAHVLYYREKMLKQPRSASIFQLFKISALFSEKKTLEGISNYGKNHADLIFSNIFFALSK